VILSQEVTGYASPVYARSLSEFGIPLALQRSGGWLLQRKITGFEDEDAMWPYPIFSCLDWRALREDLDELKDCLVCASVVTDPFGDYDKVLLKQCFSDIVMPFKQHFVVELSQPRESFVSPHHQRNARRALEVLQVEQCETPQDHLDEWVELYKTLIERHSIKGIVAFSRQAFDEQLKVPGIVAFRALYEGKTVGMVLWYVQNKVAYYHLGAYSTQGYELRASFALFWKIIHYFASNGLSWLNLGAGAGSQNDGQDGLTRFKRGWATGTRPAYFCGHIFNRRKYQEIVEAKDIPMVNFFPAYRFGEF